MPKVPVKFALGTHAPAKLGTAIVKPTSESKMSYSQNVEVQNDEYGNSVLVPGPAMPTITGNSTLTGVPYLKALYTVSTGNVGWLYVASGLLGATDKVFRIQDVEPGETPSVDTANTGTITHGAHSGIQITDMAYRGGSNDDLYIVGKDTSDGWIQKHTANASTIGFNLVSTLSTFNTGRVPKMILASDNNLYIGHGRYIDKVDTTDTYSNDVLDLPTTYGVTDLGEWQLNLIAAYNTDFAFTFDQRKSGGRSGIVIWNTTSSSFERDIPCPSRYISAVVNEPDGNLLVFGGLDEGKTTLYEFTGYGFRELYSYIGDMPRSRHSVDFDGQGRIMWITADGQICRFDKATGIFEHLGTITTGSSAGGLFSRLVGGSGNEFIAASGSGPSYTCKRVTFGSFVGDGGAGTDNTSTPLAISGKVKLPQKSVVTGIEIALNGELVSGDKLNGYLYKNGSTTPITMGTINFTDDGSIASKIIRNTQYNIDNAALGVAWKMTDASATAPGVIEGYIHYNEIKT